MFDESAGPILENGVVKDGPTQHHPFDEQARTETQSLPITPDLCCCPYGPCRHYVCNVIVERERATGMRGQLTRMCQALRDDEGEWNLSESNIDRCTLFHPPWWSWTGWKQLWIVACKLGAIHEKVVEGGKHSMPLRFWIASALGTLLHWPVPSGMSYLDMDEEEEEEEEENERG